MSYVVLGLDAVSCNFDLSIKPTKVVKHSVRYLGGYVPKFIFMLH
jgi:hypothetical protein